MEREKDTDRHGRNSRCATCKLQECNAQCNVSFGESSGDCMIKGHRGD